jgi:hypothetical protein
VNHVLKGRVTLLLCLWLFSAAAMAQTRAQPAQAAVQQRSFHAPQAQVEKALRGLGSYPGGKLPVLDGFADTTAQSLDNYKRGYYEYQVQLKASSPTETTVTVTAKITAWYGGPGEGGSGYRLLKSSGRLESDLLDALSDKLNPKPPGVTADSSLSQTKALPDSPSATVGSGTFFNTPRLTSAASGTIPAKPEPSKPTDPATAKRVLDLNHEAQNLEQILHDQMRPDNLAVVKRSNTPIAAQPVDGAEVMFQADAEDEFEVLDGTNQWVHAKISALSRGWVRREYVDLPGAATVNIAALADDQHERALVRQTKEEIGAFPGQWEPLNGKQVKIIWVQPVEKELFGSGPKWNMAKTIFRGTDAGTPAASSDISGVVVIFDAQDGGMTATTLANLQQWRAGHLSDETFWRRCWRDPADAFGGGN